MMSIFKNLAKLKCFFCNNRSIVSITIDIGIVDICADCLEERSDESEGNVWDSVIPIAF